MSLREDAVEQLRDAGRVERIARGEVLALDGVTSAIVIAGWFRVFRSAAFARDVTLFLAKRGDVLGPNALFGERGGETGAQAIGPSEVVLITADAFTQRASRVAALGIEVARTVGHRVSQVQAKLERFSRSPAEARVASALLEVCDDFGVPLAEGGHRLDLPLSQEDLAHVAGTTRETTSSAIASFRRRGLVRGVRLAGLTIVDVPGLQAVADTIV